VAHIGPVELKVGMCGVKGALEEFDLVAIDVESEIGPPTDDVAQRERYPALPTAYLQNPAAESQVAVHPEQHAPFLSPAKPLFQHPDALGGHAGEGGHQGRFIGDPIGVNTLTACHQSDPEVR